VRWGDGYRYSYFTRCGHQHSHSDADNWTEWHNHGADIFIYAREHSHSYSGLCAFLAGGVESQPAFAFN
jgi:hypothetical protein